MWRRLEVGRRHSEAVQLFLKICVFWADIEDRSQNFQNVVQLLPREATPTSFQKELELNRADGLLQRGKIENTMENWHATSTTYPQ